ncbi:MAG: hypothetical protein HWD59_09060 [Coxiellaceae bacterium]|nr:MAG: hypothetical protein HWD59_09060 [Coxiellaceae bacterium]
MEYQSSENFYGADKIRIAPPQSINLKRKYLDKIMANLFWMAGLSAGIINNINKGITFISKNSTCSRANLMASRASRSTKKPQPQCKFLWPFYIP